MRAFLQLNGALYGVVSLVLSLHCTVLFLHLYITAQHGRSPNASPLFLQNPGVGLWTRRPRMDAAATKMPAAGVAGPSFACARLTKRQLLVQTVIVELTSTCHFCSVPSMSMSRMAPLDRPVVSGKFLQVNEQRYLIKGVSYGTFAPDADGDLFPALPRVAQDFDAIAELEANTVRTYTPPPVAVLDEASRCGLRAIIGVPWMQHVAFLDRRVDEREIRRSVRDHVRRLATHPAAMLFALGNEIPPPVVRWYGRKRIERFLSDLYDEAKVRRRPTRC